MKDFIVFVLIFLAVLFFLITAKSPMEYKETHKEIVWGTIVSNGVISYSFSTMGGPFWLTVMVKTDKGDVLPVTLNEWKGKPEEALKHYKLEQGERVKVSVLRGFDKQGVLLIP